MYQVQPPLADTPEPSVQEGEATLNNDDISNRRSCGGCGGRRCRHNGGRVGRGDGGGREGRDAGCGHQRTDRTPIFSEDTTAMN